MLGERLIRRHRGGFAPGVSAILREDEPGSAGVDFAIHRVPAGTRIEDVSAKETAWILLRGEAEISFAGTTHRVKRTSIFDEPPTALSTCAATAVVIDSRGESEWAVARASNDAFFDARLFGPGDVELEQRGKDLAQGASAREVRTIFDWRARPLSKLVVGEVVSPPGKWSSYPPHHHAQPELYHYRFTEPQGYGHAELDDHVFKVRSNDTLTILGGETHAQVAAPGYGMYYLWIVRHLDDRPYRGFEHAREHAWLLDPANQGWRPRAER